MDCFIDPADSGKFVRTAGIMALIRPAKLAKSHRRTNTGGALWAPFQCGIIFVDARNRISVLTDTAARILKLSTRRRRPLTLSALPAPLQKVIAEARSTRRAIVDRRADLGDAANGGLALGLSVLPMSTDQRSSAVAVVLQDLTSARSFEQNLRQLNRLASIGTLSAGMAHEIKNALVVGKTFFDLLLEKHPDGDLVQLARRELARIDSLVSQILRFTGPAKPVLTDIRLHELLDHSLRLVERQIKDKAIQLERNYGAPCDLLPGDDVQLEQAFVNLLLNAIEAMGPHGRLTVATQAGQGRSARDKGRDCAGRTQLLRVTIRDTGVGIPRENISRLFGPFFSTKDGGTGLGLSITRRIIEEHGGVISVKSKPNQGAAFQIVLPTLDATVTRAE